MGHHNSPRRSPVSTPDSTPGSKYWSRCALLLIAGFRAVRDPRRNQPAWGDDRIGQVRELSGAGSHLGVLGPHRVESQHALGEPVPWMGTWSIQLFGQHSSSRPTSNTTRPPRWPWSACCAICSSVYLSRFIDPPFPEVNMSSIPQLGSGTENRVWVTEQPSHFQHAAGVKGRGRPPSRS